MESIERNNENNRRIEWIDVARACAIISVVLCHSTERIYNLNLEGISDLSIQSKMFAFAMFTMGRLGVPLFLFITGYLLLPRYFDGNKSIKFWKRNLFPMVITVEIWIIFYNFFLSWFNHTNLDIEFLIKTILFLKPSMPHMWYMGVIIGIYLFIPFIANTLNSLNTKLIYFPLSITFLCLFIIPSLNFFLLSNGNEGITSQLDLSFGGATYGLYVIVGYLFSKGVFQRIKNSWLLLTLFFFFSLTVIIQLMLYHQGYKYNVWYNSAPLFLAGFSLFGILKNFKITKFHTIFIRISTYSFGMYLVHFPIQLVLVKYISFKGIMPVKVISLFVFSFILSYIFVSIVKRIPIARKYLILSKS